MSFSLFYFLRIQVEDQHQQKIKSVLKSAREQFVIDQEKAIKAANEMTMKRQEELWDVERKSNLSSLEKIKNELTAIKMEHAAALERIQKDHLEEIKKLRNGINKSKDSGTQVCCRLR
jgi:hypothetical protein